MAGYEMQKPNSSLANHRAFPTVEPVPSVLLCPLISWVSKLPVRKSIYLAAAVIIKDKPDQRNDLRLAEHTILKL